jgi:UDP-N-acetylmuramate--alanine ligase
MQQSWIQAKKKAYLIGIKGVGVAALAEILVRRGMSVSGSDTDETFFTEKTLKTLHVHYHESFRAEQVPEDADVIIYSTAYTPANNPEVARAVARSAEVVVLSYPEAIGQLSAEHLTLAVCGTHGKTTTSAMLAEVLRSAKEDPLAVVGSRILQWEGNALAGAGKYFVLEADEYQNKLQYYTPHAVILTSVDWDHPDFFPTEASYESVFQTFIEGVPRQGAVVWCGDSATVERVASKAHSHSISYGFLPHNTVQILNWKVGSRAEETTETRSGSAARQSFEIVSHGISLGVFELSLAGRFNAQNAAAVIALCQWMKLDMDVVREALRNFSGTARRFEYIGSANDILVYDDYAHHPEEIRVTLKAFRELFPERRIIALFHPHTFTRTKALFADFAQSFDDADLVAAIEIYGSAREEQGGISSVQLAEAINRYHPNRAEYVATLDDALMYAQERAQPGDILVTLGAGNVWEVGRRFLYGEK